MPSTWLPLVKITSETSLDNPRSPPPRGGQWARRQEAQHGHGMARARLSRARSAARHGTHVGRAELRF